MANSDVQERIAAEVRAELARQQVTQRAAAALIDMAFPALQMRLAGKRSFRAEELVMLAAALGVPVTRFLPADQPKAAAS